MAEEKMAEGKVLIVSFYFPPVNSPGTQHPTWFFRFLPENGYETIAVTSSIYVAENLGAEPIASPNVWSLPRPSWLHSLTYKLYQTEMALQSRRGYWDHGYVWGRCFALPAAKTLLSKQRFSAMISVSPSVSSHWTALQIKKLYPDLPWIADFQDPLTGNPFRPGGREGTPFMRKLERSIFKTADVLSANTDTVQAMWSKYYPEFQDKTTVTWGGFDPDDPVQALPRSSDVPVLAHVGGLYGHRIPVALLQSLERLTGNGRLKPGDLKVLFVGDLNFGPMTELVRSLEQRGWLDLRPGYIPRPEAMRIACQSHYSLLLDITGPENTMFQVPGKLFDQIRIGRPMLAFTPSGSPTSRILEGSAIPNVCLSTDAAEEEVDAGVMRLLTLRPEPHPASACFLETFNARHLVRGLASQIRSHSSVTSY